MHPTTFLLLLSLLIGLPSRELLCTSGPALTPRIRSFTSQDYQAANQNWDITQAPNGILYVANSGGVLRYDGLDWSVHQLPGRPTVRAVAWADRRLYVGGYGEFGYFTSRQNGKLGDYTSLSDRLPAPERKEEIWNIEVLGSGEVVLQSFSHLYWYTPEKDTLRLERPGALLFAHATGDSLLVPVTDIGLITYGSDLHPHLRSTATNIVAVTGSLTTPILATTATLLHYQEGATAPWSEAVSTALAGQRINRLLQLRDGSVAVGTILGGVYIFTPDGALANHLDYGNGLSNNTVLALFEDHNGNLWAGLDRGLDLIVRSEPLRFYRQEKQPIGAVYTASEYRGQLYVGTNQGLYVQSPAGFTLVTGTAGQVWELRPTPFGLLCGHNDGTFLVEGTTARLISERSGGWQTIPLPHDSTTYLQANYTGLSTLHLGGAAGAKPFPEEAKLTGLLAPLRSFARIGESELLALHGSRGAYRIALSDDWRQIVTVDTVNSPDLIRPMLTHFGDTLLVQTADAVYRYYDKQFSPVTAFRGVNLTAGDYLLPGREGSDEWFLVARDRLMAYRGSERIAAYPVRLRTGFPSIIPLGTGEYLLCLEDGFATYRMEEAAPPEIDLHLDWSTPARGVWRFDYALPVLDRPVRYRHRLLGFEEEWSDWSALGSRDYTNLAPGDYRFQVQADWFAAQEEVSFTVPTPWYLTGWAYVAYALLLSGLLYLLYREHRKQLGVQARRLETVRQRQLQRQRIEARNKQLEEENQRKSRELANTTLTLAKKNEMLLDLKEELSRSSKGGTTKSPQKLLHLIDRNLNNEEDWKIFESHFNEVHEAFLKRLRAAHPQLTTGDLQLAAYLKMDLSSKEIAPLLHISIRGVENKRYRLRKKMGLGGEVNLSLYLQEF